MIVTHITPDFDCILATWLLKRFGGYADDSIAFMKFGQEIPEGMRDAIFVDFGRGAFDHHHRNDYVSASSLILHTLPPQDRSRLSHLTELACRIDHGLTANDALDKRSLDLMQIIEGLNTLYPDDPSRVVHIAHECLDAIHAQIISSQNIANIAMQGVTFETTWGPGIAVQTGNRAVRRYCHAKGYTVYIYVDPEKEYRGVTAPGGRGVDFSKVYEKLKELEPDAEWYLHFTKDLLICGSDKAVNRKLSTLSLEALVALVTHRE